MACDDYYQRESTPIWLLYKVHVHVNDSALLFSNPAAPGHGLAVEELTPRDAKACEEIAIPVSCVFGSKEKVHGSYKIIKTG